MLKRLLVALLVVLAAFQAQTVAVRSAEGVEALLAQMSLGEKIGQTMLVHTWGKEANDYFEKLNATIRPAGVVLLKENLESPRQIAALTDGLQRMAQVGGNRVPLLTALDQETRRIQRLRDGFTPLMSGYALGAITDPAMINVYARTVGREMRAVGVNFALAPVVDLAVQPNHPILRGRFLGDDPAQVAFVATHYLKGLNAVGVVGTLKHFPGHGAVNDTHVGRAVLKGTLDEIGMHLQPFFEAEAPMIMLGHIEAPALDDSGMPASLSAPMINYIRERGFDGVLITDALDMGAIVNRFTLEQAAVKALQSGADLLLLGAHVDLDQQVKMFQAVQAAVQAGELSEERITEAARRVLQLKADHGLLDFAAVFDASPAQAETRIAAANGAGNRVLAYANAITVAKNEGDLVPVRGNVAIIYPNGYSYLTTVCTESEAAPTINYLPVNYAPAPYQRSQAVALAQESDVVVVFTQDADQVAAQASLVRALPPEKTVVVALGSPFDLRAFPQVSGYLLAYDELEPAIYAACNALFGWTQPRGKLPVRLLP